MENLRAAQEKDLADCIEGEYGTDIILTDPNGTKYENNANDQTLKLRAKIRYTALSFDPDTGEPIVSDEIAVSIRTTSLMRVPLDGENWLINMPVAPQVGAPLEDFLFTIDRAVERATDMGYIKIKPVAVAQI